MTFCLNVDNSTYKNFISNLQLQFYKFLLNRYQVSECGVDRGVGERQVEHLRHLLQHLVPRRDVGQRKVRTLRN